MTSAWKRITLVQLSPSQWRGASWLYHLVGSLKDWHSASWLLQWAEPLGAALVCVVLALSPFVSTSLIGILLAACAGYWLLLTLSEQDWACITPIHLLVLLYWGIATVAVAFSPVKAAAFEGWIKLTLYLVMFALMARVLRSSRLTSLIVSVYLLVALVVSVYGVRQQLSGVEQLATWNDPLSDLAGTTRVYSYLGNPNLLASYLLPAIALSAAALFVWQGWLQKTLAMTMLLVNTACLYYTQSRGGWIGVMVLSLVFLLLLYYWYKDSLPPFWQKWLLPIVLGTLAAFLLIAMMFVDPLRIRVMSIFAGREDSSNNFRMNVWGSVIKMIKAYPIIGIGPGNEAFNKVYPLFMHPKYSALSAYSIFLETTVETGVIGFTCFLWLLVVTINQGVRQIKDLRQQANLQGFWLIAAVATMAGMLAHGCVDTVWYRPQISTLWWLMLALIASRYQGVFSPNKKADQAYSTAQ
ncbi:IctB family putative bicarbonate transporter [Gloeothece verrucosa]|uniref:Inorganic carbon transporter n=1 Tax=Gloeothece verrucosa (strain PCC 7822) TaxID=497965 RepID=E0UGA9_GLOV7|nr:IctB family putative bicarbonate transporter [Gloeothece verrucosa]ADN16728.1 inorganic carbon transporter [Gloeothece verrucosa PCC 7822]